MNRLILSDIDGTMTNGLVIFEVGNALAEDGVISKQGNVSFQETLRDYESGQTDYKTFVINALTKLALALTDVKVSAVVSSTQSFFQSYEGFYPWVLPTFSGSKEQGDDVYLVSATPAFIARSIANLFDAEYRASGFAVKEGQCFAGEVSSILGSQQKAVLALEAIGLHAPQSIHVFGDSAGDIGMLDLAAPIENAYCITPDDVLRKHANRSAMTIIDNPLELNGSLIN